MKMTLKDTVEYMVSDDYKARFLAEYAQLKIRYEKLKHYCDLMEADRIALMEGKGPIIKEVKHDCPYEMLRKQQKYMEKLLHIMELRAILEKIDLYEID